MELLFVCSPSNHNYQPFNTWERYSGTVKGSKETFSQQQYRIGLKHAEKQTKPGVFPDMCFTSHAPMLWSHQTNTFAHTLCFQGSAFAHTGSAAWNGLPPILQRANSVVS